MKTFEIKEQRCPCGYRFELSTNATGEEPPAPGDVSICIKCARVARFDERGELHQLSEREVDELPLKLLAEVLHVRYAIGVVRRGS